MKLQKLIQKYYQNNNDTNVDDRSLGKSNDSTNMPSTNNSDSTGNYIPTCEISYYSLLSYWEKRYSNNSNTEEWYFKYYEIKNILLANCKNFIKLNNCDDGIKHQISV